VAFDGRIPLTVELDGDVTASETVFAQAGAYVLTIATTIARADLPLEVHSTYVGHPGCRTHATHLRLGPDTGQREILHGSHEDGDICVVFSPRNAVYDHAHTLVEVFREAGHNVAIRVPDDAFQLLEAVGDQASMT
jgi:hypothetical protein